MRTRGPPLAPLRGRRRPAIPGQPDAGARSQAAAAIPLLPSFLPARRGRSPPVSPHGPPAAAILDLRPRCLLPDCSCGRQRRTEGESAARPAPTRGGRRRRLWGGCGRAQGATRAVAAGGGRGAGRTGRDALLRRRRPWATGGGSASPSQEAPALPAAPRPGKGFGCGALGAWEGRGEAVGCPPLGGLRAGRPLLTPLSGRWGLLLLLLLLEWESRRRERRRRSGVPGGAVPSAAVPRRGRSGSAGNGALGGTRGRCRRWRGKRGSGSHGKLLMACTRLDFMSLLTFLYIHM